MTGARLLRFSKLEALGNDFVLVDARMIEPVFSPDRIRELADRHRGIGFDQLLVLRPANDERALCRVDIHNSDGGTAEQCGNGMRAVALWLHRNEQLASSGFLQTAGGLVRIDFKDQDRITATLAEPVLDPAAWGSRVEQPGWSESVAGELCHVRGLSMGNPHLVLEWPRPPTLDDVQRAGEHFRGDTRLPKGANIGLAHLVGRDRIELAVNERGAGPTRACGSGACAAAVVMVLAGHVDPPVTVHQPGGELVINWQGSGHEVEMTGPARHVFEGTITNEQSQ